MAARKKSVEYATKDDFRAIGVMFERIESSVNVLAEGLASFRSELKHDLRAVEERLSNRISILEDVVRKNSEDIRKNSEDIRKNSEDIRLVKIEVAELRLRFDQRDTRMDDLESRVAAVEKRLGLAS
jgi:chromosome segregation ATPase